MQCIWLISKIVAIEPKPEESQPLPTGALISSHIQQPSSAPQASEWSLGRMVFKSDIMARMLFPIVPLLARSKPLSTLQGHPRNRSVTLLTAPRYTVRKYVTCIAAAAEQLVIAQRSSCIFERVGDRVYTFE